MKKILLGITLISTTSMFAQSVSPEVVASAGAHFAIPSVQISWTLGETVTQTISNSSATLTQGFQQSSISVIGVETLDPLVEINVYPNPISDFVKVELSDNVINSQMILVDATGRILLTEPVLTSHFTIDFSSYAKGTYYLNFKNSNGSILQTITLQKIN